MSASDFTIIRPVDVRNATLTSSTITEADYGAYNAGTTYALGDRCIVVSPTSTVTITNASPAVVSWTAHGQPVGTKIVFSTTGTLPAGITAGTVYYVVAVTADTFKISDQAGGNPLNTTSAGSGTHTATCEVHEIYESLQAGNLAHYPRLAASSTWWLLVGATNRWQMFDQKYNSQSTKTDTIVVVLTPGELINAIAVLNVEGASVRVQQSISGYDSTQYLNSHLVDNWYDWFYEPLIRTGDLVFAAIPPYASGVLTVTVDNTGDTARLGCLIYGTSRTLGLTRWNPERTINDYSTTSEDQWGNVTLVPRTYSKRMNAEFYMTQGFEPEVTRLLEEYRATPIVVIGSSDYSSTIIYGWLGSWAVPITNEMKPATITIKGLV